MKISEIKDLSADDLARRAAEMRENLFNLKIRLSAGNLDSSADIGKTKRDLARVMTVLNQKKAAEPRAPKAVKPAQAPAAAEGK